MNRWGPNKKPRPCDRGSHPSVIEDLETHPYGSAIRARSLVGILAQALTKRCGLLPVRAHRAAHAGCRSLRALDRRVSEWIEGLQTRGEAGGAAGVEGAALAEVVVMLRAELACRVIRRLGRGADVTEVGVGAAGVDSSDRRVGATGVGALDDRDIQA